MCRKADIGLINLSSILVVDLLFNFHFKLKFILEKVLNRVCGFFYLVKRTHQMK